MHCSWSKEPPPWVSDQPVACDPQAAPSLRLHQEIVGLMTWLSPTEHETHLRMTVQNELTFHIQQYDPLSAVDLFGSHSYGVGLPTSDLDLNVTSSRITDVDMLKSVLEATQQYTHFFVVRKCRVPVVSCQHRNSCIDLDVTLNNPGGRITGQAAKQLLDRHPVARPLVVVVKYFLRQRKLCEVACGGLSSYAMCAMVVSFLLHRPQNKPVRGYGQLLIEFLRLYAFDFNYADVAIDVANQMYIKKPPPHRANLAADLLYVVDPADNTNNVSNASKKIRLVRCAFLDAYNVLTAHIPPADDIYRTLLGRVLQRDKWLTALREYYMKASTQRIETVLRQIDPSPFLPEARPTFLQSPTLTFAAVSAIYTTTTGGMTLPLTARGEIQQRKQKRRRELGGGTGWCSPRPQPIPQAPDPRSEEASTGEEYDTDF